MRDGLRTLTDLVDRIEGDGVVVDDASISRADDDEISVDISMRFPADGATVSQAEDGAGTVDDRLYRGGTTRTDPAAAAAPGQPDSPPDGADSPPGQADSADSNGVPSGSEEKAPNSVAVPPGFGETAARVGGPVVGSFVEARETVDRSPVRNGELQENHSGSSSDDELVTCRVDGCDERFETEHGMKIHATKAHQSDDGSAPSPHRNPERLREVYEACDTFEEMTAALDVDVTSQTVRRSMMRLGVHDPAADDGAVSSDGVMSGDSAMYGGGGSSDGRSSDDESSGDQAARETDAGEASDESDAGLDDQVAGADTPDRAAEPAGGGTAPRADEPDERAAEDDDAVLAGVDDALPPDVDGVTFVDAVRTASTLYEVQRRLDMDRGAVQTLLAELDLLDLVHGRVANQGEREEQKAEIERRILETVGERTDADRDEPTGADENTDDRASDGPGEQARAD